MRNFMITNTTWLATLLVVLGCLAAPALAQQKKPARTTARPNAPSRPDAPGRKPADKPAEKPASGGIQTVFLPGKSPVVSFRIQFLTGAVDDPAGKEGLAALTAAMLSQGGTKSMTYDQIVGEFYPMAVGFGAQSDMEMTTFIGQTHVDNLSRYYGLISRMLLDPGFRENDFKRLKQDAINYLKVSLRESNDEELGKERLYENIYAGTAYGHHSIGRVAALEKITLDDVKSFYRDNYLQGSVVIGLAGGFDTKFSKEMFADFQRLPKGGPKMRKLAAPKLDPGMKIDIVKRETRATALSLGFPIDITRSTPKEFAALSLVASYFGQHRSSNSYLYGRIREARGLNYGDYAYVEYFPRGMFQFQPDPNLARRFQIFQMWIRPVEPQNANFVLRAALYEYDKLLKNGLDEKTFAETRDFLIKYVNILTQTKDLELGYALDSKFYGTGDFNKTMKDELGKLTLADVNRIIKEHLTSNDMRVVLVTKDAEGLRKQIVDNVPATIEYAAPKPPEIVEEDKVIGVFPIRVKPENVTVTAVDKVFQ